MTRKLKRLLPVLCLVATILSTALLPTAGYGENLRFVFLADSPGTPSPFVAINTPVLSAIVAKIVQLSPRPWAVFYGGDQAMILDAPLFQSVMQPLTDAGIKFYTALGNHELWNQDSSQGQFYLSAQTAYQQAFTANPTNGPAGYDHLAYSVNSPGGDAFFAVLDPYYLTADDLTPNLTGHITDAQLTWLGAQLANTKAIHKFLFIHTPFSYVDDPEGPAPGAPDASFTNLWTILDNNRFDIYFCGHEHLYSRNAIGGNTTLYPARSTPKWKNNVVQLICGTCGAAIESGTVVDPTEWRVSNSANTYYFSVVDIAGSSVKVSSYSGYQTASDYNVFDTFTIGKIPPLTGEICCF